MCGAGCTSWSKEKSKTHTYAVGRRMTACTVQLFKVHSTCTYLVPSTKADAKRLGATLPLSYLHRALLFTQ